MAIRAAGRGGRGGVLRNRGLSLAALLSLTGKSTACLRNRGMNTQQVTRASFTCEAARIIIIMETRLVGVFTRGGRSEDVNCECNRGGERRESRKRETERVR